MISAKHFVNKLRALGYRFKDRRHRVDLWRKEGGTHCVMVPRKNQVSEVFVRSALRQCGLEEYEIQEFLDSARA
jgi:hypothetical protein